MKKVTQRIIKSNSFGNSSPQLLDNFLNQQRFAAHIQTFLESLFSTPIKSKQNLLDRNVNYFINNNVGEFITKQTISKSFFPRISYPKQDQIAAINAFDHNVISPKIVAVNADEKSDSRFLNEILIASKFCEQSELIDQLIMNSESTLNKIVTKTSTNKNADVTINIKGTLINRDIKSGNNMNYVKRSIIGPISYTNDNKPYAILNNPLDLKNINQERIQLFDFVTPFQEELNFIYKDKDLDFIQKNLLIQEKCLAFVKNNPDCTVSFYVVVKVNEFGFNQNFFLKIQNRLNNNMFDNKKNSQDNIAYYINSYDQTIAPIMNNIEKSKEILKNTGFESVLDVLFHN